VPGHPYYIDVFLRLFTIWLLYMGCAYWIGNLIATILLIKKVGPLTKSESPALKSYPKLSVIITARDEAATLEKAMESRLRDDYPDVEFILVDDRSTDGTSDIVNRIACNDPRVKPLHITELPDGWLGKVWALNEGSKMSNGEWFLFSDGDVHLEPGTLKKSIEYVEDHGYDHLSLIPEIESGSFILDIVLAVFFRLLSISARFWDVQNPKSNAYMGIGAFNLVRRSAFERTLGFEWLKLEPGDDAALGKLMKLYKFRSSILIGVGLIRVKWYSSIREMTVGMERTSLSAFAGYGMIRPVVQGILGLIAELSPYLALFFVGFPSVQIMGAVGLSASILVALGMSRWSHRPIVPGLLAPIGIVIMIGMLLRGAWLGHVRGGIYWRGTFYSIKTLRDGHRVTIP
jgi:hypothetical protein